MSTKIKHYISVILVVMAMTTLAGCKPDNNSNSSEPDSSTTSTSDTGIEGDPQKEIVAYSDETFDMRYKHWFDNPDVADSQKELLELGRSGTSVDRKHLGLFQLYEDESGREYYISGRELVYVPSTMDTHGLSKMRDEDGKLHYPHLTGVTDVAFLGDFSAVTGEQEQSTAFDDYAKVTTFAELKNDVDYQVFINNLKTDIIFNTKDVGISLNDWFTKYNLLSIDNGDYQVRHVYLNTGVGIRTVQLEAYSGEDKDWAYTWTVTCLEDAASVVVGGSEISVFGDELYFTPEAIERILGYQIQVYENAINIITDNKDLADKDSVMPSLRLTVITDPNLPSTPKQPAKH